MVYFPEFWYLGENTVDGWRLYVSETEIEGFHHAEASLVGAFIGRLSSSSPDQICRSIGKENGGFNTATGISDNHGILRKTLENRGVGFHCRDWQQHNIICWMFMARYKTRNCISILGKGFTASYSESGIGLTIKLGNNDSNPNSGLENSVSFLGIEGLYVYSYNPVETIEGIHVMPDRRIAAYDKGYYRNNTEYSDISSPSKRILPGILSDDPVLIKEMVFGNYGDMYPFSTMTSSEYGNLYFCGIQYSSYFSTTYNGWIMYICNETSEAPNSSSIFSIGCSPDFDFANMLPRLCFDGTITVVDDVNTFKSIKDAVIG